MAILPSERRHSSRGRLRAGLLAAAAVLAPASAEAHVALKSMGSFWSGVAHQLTSLDQVCFLVGLAIWMSFFDRRLDTRVIGLVFAGIFVGAVADPEGRFALAGLVAALMAAVGFVGAVRIRAGTIPVLGLAFVGALIAGDASASAATGLPLALFSLGSAIAGASVLSYGLLGARHVEVEWGRIALRAAASWIGAAGLMLLAFAVSHVGGRG